MAELEVIQLRREGKIILRSEDETQLRDSVEALRYFGYDSPHKHSNYAEEHFERLKFIRKDNLFEVDVTPLIPKDTLNLITHCHESRSNCWGTALFFRKMIPSLRFVNRAEFSNFLVSPFCYEISNFEQIEPGDIGTIKQNEGSEGLQHQHAFVFISEDLVFEQSGPGMPFGLKNVERAISGASPKIAVTIKEKGFKKARWDSGVAGSFSIYRCTEPAQDEMPQPGHPGRKAQEMLSDLECSLATYQVSQQPIPRDRLISMQQQASDISNWMGKLAKDHRSPDDLVQPYLDLLRVKAMSLAYTLNKEFKITKSSEEKNEEAPKNAPINLRKPYINYKEVRRVNSQPYENGSSASHESTINLRRPEKDKERQ